MTTKKETIALWENPIPTEVKNTYEPILYLIMRGDLASMNPGKAIAQGSHAANKAAKHAERQHPYLYEGWATQASGQDFGTVLTLSAKNMAAIDDLLLDIEAKLILAKKEIDLQAVFGTVFDPTYPLKDGSTVHYIPLHTCGYVMCYKGSATHNLIKEREKDFPLHK